jgi:hypothetical protein
MPEFLAPYKTRLINYGHNNYLKNNVAANYQNPTAEAAYGFVFQFRQNELPFTHLEGDAVEQAVIKG